jgi:hypothetical protein
VRPDSKMLKLCGACLAAGAVAAAPALAAGTARSPSPGHVYGGVTPQNWPIVVDVNKAGTSVTRIVIGLDMTCTSNENFGTTDGFTDVKFNSKSRFKTSFGPQRIDAAGVPADIQGAITGRRSKDKRSIKGTWNYKVTFYDAAGANVVDSCDSGLVSWKAEQ